MAYGSNTNIDQMKRRCPKAKLVGTGVVEGWKLVFQKSRTGFYLNIIPGKPTDWVPVVVWGLDDESEMEMDIYEGYPSCYQKKTFTLEVRNGKRGKNPTMECFAYLMPKSREFGLPSTAYFDRCSAGYKTFGFQQRILDEAYMYSSHRSGFRKAKSRWEKMK